MDDNTSRLRAATTRVEASEERAKSLILFLVCPRELALLACGRCGEETKGANRNASRYRVCVRGEWWVLLGVS